MKTFIGFIVVAISIFTFKMGVFAQEPILLADLDPRIGLSHWTDADGVVFLFGKDGRLHAFDAREGGKRLWDPFPIGYGDAVYPVRYGKAERDPLQWSKDKRAFVFVNASEDKKLYALYEDTGEEKWEFPMKGILPAPPAVQPHEGFFAPPPTLYIGCGDGNVYALDPETGEKKWEHSTDGTLNARVSPVIGKTKLLSQARPRYSLYIVCLRELRALDLETGRIQFTIETNGVVEVPPLVSREEGLPYLIVCVNDVNRNAEVRNYRVDRDQERITESQQTFFITGEVTVPPELSGGKAVIVSNKGAVSVFEMSTDTSVGLVKVTEDDAHIPAFDGRTYMRLGKDPRNLIVGRDEIQPYRISVLGERTKNEISVLGKRIKNEWPEPEELLFRIDAALQSDLDSEGNVSEGLKQAFRTAGKWSLSDHAFVSVLEADKLWHIIDDRKMYAVRKAANGLNVYSAEERDQHGVELEGIIHLPFDRLNNTLYVNTDTGSTRLLYAIDTLSGSVYWMVESGIGIESPTVLNGGEDRVFVQATDNSIYVIDLNERRVPEEAAKKLFSGLEISNSMVCRGDTLYFGSGDGYFYAVEADPTVINDEDKILWDYPTEGTVVAKARLGADDTISFTSKGKDGRVYVLDAETSGQHFHRFGSDSELNFISPGFSTTPAVTDETVYACGDDGRLYILAKYVDPDDEHKRDLRLRGLLDLSGEIKITSSPAVEADSIYGGHLIYFGTDDGKVYAVRDTGRRTPEIVWRFRLGNDPVRATPAVIDGLVIIGYADTIYAIEEGDGIEREGKERWKVETGGKILAPPVINKERGQVYIGSMDGFLYAIDVTTGAHQKLPDQPTSGIAAAVTMNQTRDKIYFGSKDGKVYEYRLSSSILLSTPITASVNDELPTLPGESLKIQPGSSCRILLQKEGEVLADVIAEIQGPAEIHFITAGEMGINQFLTTQLEDYNLKSARANETLTIHHRTGRRISEFSNIAAVQYPGN